MKLPLRRYALDRFTRTFDGKSKDSFLSLDERAIAFMHSLSSFTVMISFRMQPSRKATEPHQFMSIERLWPERMNIDKKFDDGLIHLTRRRIQ